MPCLLYFLSLSLSTHSSDGVECARAWPRVLAWFVSPTRARACVLSVLYFDLFNYLFVLLLESEPEGCAICVYSRGKQ